LRDKETGREGERDKEIKRKMMAGLKGMAGA
jgi:hypothetical protein